MDVTGLGKRWAGGIGSGRRQRRCVYVGVGEGESGHHVARLLNQVSGGLTGRWKTSAKRAQGLRVFVSAVEGQEVRR